MSKPATARSPLYFGWYVVAAVTFIAFVNTGTRSSFGIFVIPMSEEYKAQRACLRELLDRANQYIKQSSSL